MKAFVEKFSLEKAEDDNSKNKYTALYDSNGIIIELTGKYFGLLDKLKLIRHFGFF